MGGGCSTHATVVVPAKPPEKQTSTSTSTSTTTSTSEQTQTQTPTTYDTPTPTQTETTQITPAKRNSVEPSEQETSLSDSQQIAKEFTGTKRPTVSSLQIPTNPNSQHKPMIKSVSANNALDSPSKLRPIGERPHSLHLFFSQNNSLEKNLLSALGTQRAATPTQEGRERGRSMTASSPPLPPIPAGKGTLVGGEMTGFGARKFGTYERHIIDSGLRRDRNMDAFSKGSTMSRLQKLLENKEKPESGLRISSDDTEPEEIRSADEAGLEAYLLSRITTPTTGTRPTTTQTNNSTSTTASSTPKSATQSPHLSQTNNPISTQTNHSTSPKTSHSPLLSPLSPSSPHIDISQQQLNNIRTSPNTTTQPSSPFGSPPNSELLTPTSTSTNMPTSPKKLSPTTLTTPKSPWQPPTPTNITNTTATTTLPPISPRAQQTKQPTTPRSPSKLSTIQPHPQPQPQPIISLETTVVAR